jgi:hypothetical protein
VFLESHINGWHHFLHDTLLYVYRLEKTREPRTEDVMHMISVVEVNKRCICTLGCKVAEEHGSDGSHPLTVPAPITI